ncbi:MAG: sugar-binding transcriptional regulator [Anaerolineales bacterium]|nr:sugar-binding transcriptional regulator [Anaerolineales bacterium]
MKKINVRLLTRIAIMYYRDGLTHKEIASRLGVSRQKVGRFLDAARDEGLVEIQIKSPLLYASELETRLENEFQLKEAVVVSPAWEGEDAIKETLGMAGAEFLERHVQPGDTLGVSWGSTVLEVARNLKPMKRENITVLQLNGSMDVGSYSTRASYTVELVARAFDAQMVTLSAPMMVDRSEILESLLSDSQIAAALNLALKSNIALFGVGDVSELSSPFKVGYYNHQLLTQLQAEGAIGEIIGRFYDRNGQPCSPELQGRTLAVDLENLKQKKLSIAVAALPHKRDAILGMLRGKYCNALITDEATAKALLTS